MKEIIGKKDELFIDWVMHDICNYKCHYCISNREIYPFPDLSKVSLTLDNLATRYKNITYQISGGEPTVWKELPEFFELLYAKTPGVCKVELVTNGSVPPSYWNKINPNVKVFFSLHYLEMKSIDNFISTIIACRSSFKKVLILMIPEYFDKLIEYHAMIVERIPGIIISCKPIDTRHLMETEKEQTSFVYTPAQKKIMSELNSKYANKVNSYYAINDDDSIEVLQPFNLVINKQNNFQGWECNMGIEKLLFLFGGEIRIGACIGSTVLPGNWRTGEPSVFPNKPVICKNTGCFCISDIMISKRKL